MSLVRAESEPFSDEELGLLSLLGDQLAVAMQNARDYLEKLEQAIRDPLTGLYNRRFFLEVFAKEVARSKRYASDCSLVIFDVDDFKKINDHHGHAAGDDVLRAIGQTVSELIRPVDVFARLGGEEFGLLLPETKALDALLVADRVRAAVTRRELLPDRSITLSGGISSSPADGVDPAGIQKRADAALYWSKRHGKDICAVAGEVNLDEEGPTSRTESVVAQLASLVAMIDGQHLHTREHSQNVAAYAVAIGKELGLDAERLMRLRRAGLLHDIGKVGVPAAILNKPDRLTDEEFAQITSHAAVGAMVLAHAGLREEASWVRHHHERIDGRGYPDGLTGDAIPFEARVLFVADSLEAMTSDRPYHRGMPTAEAEAELRRCAGTQFDATVVEAALALIESGRMDLDALRDPDAATAA